MELSNCWSDEAEGVDKRYPFFIFEHISCSHCPHGSTKPDGNFCEYFVPLRLRNKDVATFSL